MYALEAELKHDMQEKDGELQTIQDLITAMETKMKDWESEWPNQVVPLLCISPM